MTAPSQIIDLVERFERNRKAYLSPEYNETQLRQELVNPFFEALGWDIYNKQGYAEPYKDVIHEYSLKIGDTAKAPDYCFRIGGARKFFVETKKPAVNIKEDATAAFQLRRYAWSAKLPLSILTDFEELAVYDTRVKPVVTDKASAARILYLKYTDYPERWSEIESVFSRDAILKGAFDKYVNGAKSKKGTSEVDDAFLEEIEGWRNDLARNVALRNTELTQRELNFAVQVTIDRIIFLRICEDRGVEIYGRLMALLNGENIYRRLMELFTQADEKYNSGLFHFSVQRDRKAEPDRITPKLNIDDKVLKDIIKRIYYPDSPYEFSVLPADILGQVYEQFLGKVIRLTAGHHAVVEDKPEVKKAGGVYYTPTYIVDYIVKNTVGKFLEDKKPGPRGGASKLKILDPACGSGSFLIGAFQYILDWHRDKYFEDGPEKHTKELYQSAGGEWRLTTAERKRILLNNIYGVDIDSQAVEVTKLSLLLKVLEGENEETLSTQLRMFRERALPDLANNIKCGNSLIGPDFYQNRQMNLLDEEEMYRVNAFDWNAEFPDIMKEGGFDAVIGNPPYVRQETLGKDFKEYMKGRYSSFASTADLLVYFVEKAHMLLRNNGHFGMICSNKFMRSNYGKFIRDYLFKNTTIRQIIDFGELPVFYKSATFPVILLTSKIPTQKQSFIYAPIKSLDFESLSDEVTKIKKELNGRSIDIASWTLADKKESDLFDKMRNDAVPLHKYIDKKIYFGIKTGLNKAFVIDKNKRDELIKSDRKYTDKEIYRGVITGLNEAFVIDKNKRDELIKENRKSAKLIKLFVVGDDIRKYRIRYRNTYLILIPKGWTRAASGGAKNAWEWFRNNYKALANHLSKFQKTAQNRCDKGEYWWELRACDYYKEFEKPKIIYPDIAKESRVAFDNDGLYLANTIYFIPSDDLYLLGLLNSKLIFHYQKRNAAVLGDADKGGRVRWFSQYVKKIPLHQINFSDPSEKSRHDRMVEFVTLMLDMNKRLSETATDHERNALQRRIDATDKQIDQLVYELYDLTEEEIKIVEEST